jgi:Prp8 binding protein
MAATVKRPLSEISATALVPAKRARQEIVEYGQRKGDGTLVAAGPPRTSALEAPIMLLTGHENEIYSSKFSPTGEILATGGLDKSIFLWNVYGECENFAVLKGHTGAIMEVQFSTDGSLLFSASTDKTVFGWDIETGVRVKRFRGHTSFVNSCCPSRRGDQMVVSGSDDGMIKLWDIRQKSVSQTFSNIYQVTAVCFNDSGDQIASGGIDNDIKIWDLRKTDVLYTLPGHTDTVTGLRLSPDGSYLLSNSMDNSVVMWDIRPFAPQQRRLHIFVGLQHNFEKNLLRCAWSPNGQRIAAGSADRCVYVWNTSTCQIVYKLPGHRGSVNDVDFHPKEPICELLSVLFEMKHLSLS